MKDRGIILGDALTVLRTMQAESVHCCVTSPPYWGLRDYGTATWEGGEAGCDHLGEPFRTSANINANWDGGSDVKNSTKRQPFRAVCGKCGARRIDSQLGLEATPELYVERMVEVFHEVRRVLRKDGTLWLNMGDSYAANGISGLGTTEGHGAFNGGAKHDNRIRERQVPIGLKPKDLVGIPWRLAFALQADGWWLRSDIIWSKPNPMPESVPDRPTKAHEYLFLMSRSATYYYDADAIREITPERSVIKMPDGWDTGAGGHGSFHRNGREKKGSTHMLETPRKDGDRWREVEGGVAGRGTRNKRTVWEIATQPYPEAHFATFPEALVEPCIKAGCPKDGTVLDPFAGSGTTLAVAKRLGREYIGIELNPAYITLINCRVDHETFEPDLFAELPA